MKGSHMSKGPFHFIAILQKTRNYIAKGITAGFLLAPPTQRSVRIGKRVAKTLIFLQVGFVKVIGGENLRDLDADSILSANHPHYIDPLILETLLEMPARYMTAQGVLQFAFGLGALLLGPLGAFAANLDENMGGSAYRAAIKVLLSNQTLVMFPEGWAYLDGVTRSFKKGTARIAQVASRKLARDIKVVPVFFRYGRYPGSWINQLTPPLQYLLVFLGFLYYRRGVTIVIGKPICSAELPIDVVEATSFLRERILALDPALECTKILHDTPAPEAKLKNNFGRV